MTAGSPESIIDVQSPLIPRCADLFAAVFNGPPWNESWTIESASQRLAEIAGTPGFAGVALVAGDTVTGVSLGQAERWHTGRVFCLREMFVRPGLQRQGRGSRLLAALGERIPDAAGHYLITDRGSPAQAFYEKHGYAEARGRVMMTRRADRTDH
jgi:GNAT superfamily N-acetyltransferase